MCMQAVFLEGFILVKFARIFSVKTTALPGEQPLCQVPAPKYRGTGSSH